MATNKKPNMYNMSQEGVVKTLIANPDAINDVVRMINENDFIDVNYQTIYSALLQLNRQQKQISTPEIYAQIVEDNQEAAIDPSWILSLTTDSDRWLAQASPEAWARILKRESSNRRIREVGKKASELSATGDPTTTIPQLQEELTQISIDNVIDDSETREQHIEDYIKFVEERKTTDDRAIPSLYPSLDRYTTGWLPGQLITIGARTSVGKTVFAANSITAAAAAGKSVLMFSLEMSRNELMDRFVSSLSLIPLGDLKTKDLDEEQQKSFDFAIDTIRNSKIEVDDTANVTIDYIRSKAIKKAQSIEGLDMIVLDYLQLIDNPNRGNGSRQESVAQISREMKILAKQLNIPIMNLVQLNRENKDDAPDALPKMSDIRESGAIAQDSDIVILIHRKLDDESVDPKALFLIEKNRNGRTGKKLSVRAKLQYATFDDSVHDDDKAIDSEQDVESAESGIDDISSAFSGGFSNDDFPEGDIFSSDTASSIASDLPDSLNNGGDF